MAAPVKAPARMPDLKGLPVDRARKLIAHLGLEEGEVRFVHDKATPRNAVVRQDPTPGSPLQPSEEVSLWIARQSFVRHLPGLYQENGDRATNFLEEYLWIFQHIFSSIEERLENLPRYLDAYTAPPDFLPWLASWVALDLDTDWPEVKQRLLIKRMVEIYNYRGTAHGLALYLEIFTGVEPVIHENNWPFPGFQVGCTGEIGVDAIILPPISLAHSFVVALPMQAADLTLETIYKIHRIIEVEKPSHTRYILRFKSPEEEHVAPGFRIGFTPLKEEKAGRAAAKTTDEE